MAPEWVREALAEGRVEHPDVPADVPAEHLAVAPVELLADSPEWDRAGSSKPQKILALESADHVDKLNHLRKPRLDEQVDSVARAFY